MCECDTGYRLSSNQRRCIDIDECCMHIDDCEGECYNTPGSFECDCPIGFELGDNGKSCSDIDECESDLVPKGGCSQMCENAEGGFSCACLDGYELLNDTMTCAKPYVYDEDGEVQQGGTNVLEQKLVAQQELLEDADLLRSSEVRQQKEEMSIPTIVSVTVFAVTVVAAIAGIAGYIGFIRFASNIPTPSAGSPLVDSTPLNDIPSATSIFHDVTSINNPSTVDIRGSISF